jgi:hypothetical protein
LPLHCPSSISSARPVDAAAGSPAVEHLVSGTSTDFASLRGLLAFFAAFLDAPRDPQ